MKICFSIFLFLAITQEDIQKVKSQKDDKERNLPLTDPNQNILQPFKLNFSPVVPPPPPIFALGRKPVQASYHIIQYPYTHTTPWNLYNYPQINNPYYGHLWPNHPLHGSAYGYMPFGLHPFMFPSMGAYGMNPLTALNPMFNLSNPFMNPALAANSLQPIEQQMQQPQNNEVAAQQTSDQGNSEQNQMVSDQRETLQQTQQNTTYNQLMNDNQPQLLQNMMQLAKESERRKI